MQEGERLQFTFDKREFGVIEVLENPNISMWWMWKSEICPHCKQVIEKRTLHNFNKIAILIPFNMPIETSTWKDVHMVGITLDRKELLLTKDKMEEVLPLAQKLKHLLGVKI